MGRPRSYDVPVTSDRQDFGVLLSLAGVTFAEELRAHVQAAGFPGFSTRTGFVLRLLLAEPLGLRRLADRMHMTPQATLKVVDAMTEAGYVDRVDSPADGRVRLVAVSKRGREALATARAFHEKFEAELAASVGDATGEDVRRALECIAQRSPVVVPTGSRGSAQSGTRD